jgi:hypothetical protein
MSTVQKAAEQREIVAALRACGAMRLGERLERCMAVRLARRRGDCWPSWTCASAACRWCGSTIARRWWLGLCAWIEQGDSPITLAILPLRHQPSGLRAAVARLRRSLRDLRDRQAKRQVRWRSVAMAGMAASGDTAFVHVRHSGLARSEVDAVLRRRWPDLIISDPNTAAPTWRFSPHDAAELARIRRGVEPLRITVLPQRIADAHRRDACAQPVPIEPMPLCL